MPARRKMGSRRKSPAHREFESLLRRAAAYFEARKPRRVTKPAGKKSDAA